MNNTKQSCYWKYTVIKNQTTKKIYTCKSLDFLEILRFIRSKFALNTFFSLKDLVLENTHVYKIDYSEPQMEKKMLFLEAHKDRMNIVIC